MDKEICFIKIPFSPMIKPHRAIGNLVGLFRTGKKGTPEGLFQQLVHSYLEQQAAFLQNNHNAELYQLWSDVVGKSMFEKIQSFADERNETIEAAYDVITRAIYCQPNSTRSAAQQALFETVYCVIFKDMIYNTIKTKLSTCCRRKNKKMLRIYAAKKQKTS